MPTVQSAVPPILNQISRFAAVGVVATAFHYGILILLVTTAAATPVLATAIGAVAGAVCSYALNRRLTFRSERRHREAMPRFVLVAAAGASVNALLMWLLVDFADLHYLAAQVAATLLILLLNFFANRHWTFSAA